MRLLVRQGTKNTSRLLSTSCGNARTSLSGCQPTPGPRAFPPAWPGSGCLALCFILSSLLIAQAISAAPPTRVVFSGLTDEGSWDLWLGDRDGAQLTRATYTADIDERTPVLSPDRKHVAFSTSRGDLQLYNVYDRAARVLSLPGSGRFAWPAWGPDAQSLYYVEVQMGRGPDEGKIWRYDLRSAKAEPVADQPEVEGWPAVSDDGVLLFTTWTQSQSCSLSTMPAQPRAAPTLLWDKSLTLSGAARLASGTIAAIAGDMRGQKVILLRDGKLQREFDVPGASGRPTRYEEGLLLTRIQDGLAGIHVMDISSGQTHLWTKTVPKGLLQMRDPDYR